MPVTRAQRSVKLRLAPGRQSGLMAGVVIFDEVGPQRIAPGSRIFARVRRPVELNEASLGIADLQPYTFDHGPPPANWNTLGGVGPFRMQRVLSFPGSGPGGSGASIAMQEQPVWAPFPAPVVGSLRQWGKTEHYFVMPGHPSFLPAIKEEDAHFLRFRWAGTAISGATIVAAMAAATSASGSFPSSHRDLVPGSILVTFATGAAPSNGTVMRDDGHGRITGLHGEGTVDYQAGTFAFRFQAAETGNLTVDYEHSCLYRPLDAYIEWDALLGGN